MKAKVLIEILQQHPELPVKVIETRKHEDAIPALNVIAAEISILDNDERVVLLSIEPNPKTVVKP